VYRWYILRFGVHWAAAGWCPADWPAAWWWRRRRWAPAPGSGRRCRPRADRYPPDTAHGTWSARLAPFSQSFWTRLSITFAHLSYLIRVYLLCAIFSLYYLFTFSLEPKTEMDFLHVGLGFWFVLLFVCLQFALILIFMALWAKPHSGWKKKLLHNCTHACCAILC